LNPLPPQYQFSKPLVLIVGTKEKGTAMIRKTKTGWLLTVRIRGMLAELFDELLRITGEDPLTVAWKCFAVGAKLYLKSLMEDKDYGKTNQDDSSSPDDEGVD